MFFSIICARFMNNVLSATQLCTLLWKILNIAMICVQEYGDYIRPKQIVRSNRVSGEHKLCYTLQGELMPKVYYRVNKYQLLHIGLYHAHKKKILIPFFFFFLVLFGWLCCWIFMTWEKNNCERVSPKPLVNFSNCVQNHGIFLSCHFL